MNETTSLSRVDQGRRPTETLTIGNGCSTRRILTCSEVNCCETVGQSEDGHRHKTVAVRALIAGPNTMRTACPGRGILLNPPVLTDDMTFEALKRKGARFLSGLPSSPFRGFAPHFRCLTFATTSSTFVEPILRDDLAGAVWVLLDVALPPAPTKFLPLHQLLRRRSSLRRKRPHSCRSDTGWCSRLPSHRSCLAILGTEHLSALHVRPITEGPAEMPVSKRLPASRP